MSTAPKITAQVNEVPANYRPVDPCASDDDDNIHPPINDVISLKRGHVNTSKNDVLAPYTILLVGETGVGKSAVLQLIANVLKGNDIDHYDFNILNHSNEQGGSDNQSQTNEAQFYEFKSNNNIVVRILDTPGLADTRGIPQDEFHKRSIATEIQKNIDSVTAVLILANGTIPRITVGTDYALSTLSTIFPKTLANNIAFLFTNVPSPLSWNFSEDTIPDVLRCAPRFLLDNPIALQRKYLSLNLKGDTKKRMRAEMRKAVQAGEQRALESVLVELFDWLDGLDQQPTTEIIHLYELSQNIEAMITDSLARMEQAAAKKVEIDKLRVNLENNSNNLNAFANFERTVNTFIWKQQGTSTNNMVCGQIHCYSNCHINYKTNIPLELKGLFGRSCSKCGHTLWNHHRCRSKWGKIFDQQIVVDENMKQKWEAAKNEKEKAAVLIGVREKALHDLNQVIDRATNDLIQLVERYARLALSGSFSAQVASAVKLLEHNYVALEKKRVGQDQLQRVKAGLDHMKKKLELLHSTKEKAQENVR